MAFVVIIALNTFTDFAFCECISRYVHMGSKESMTQPRLLLVFANDILIAPSPLIA
jgi:hypothetical protein